MEEYLTVCVHVWSQQVKKQYVIVQCSPQWGAVDTEIKVPFGENTELKRSPFKA